MHIAAPRRALRARVSIAALALLPTVAVADSYPARPTYLELQQGGIVCKPGATCDGSPLKAGPTGGVLRSLADRAADEINIKDLKAGVCTGNAAIDTAALDLAIGKATLAPGSTIRLPACTYRFAVTAGTFGFRLPSGTTLRGDGARTIITWNDAEATAQSPLYLFGPADGANADRSNGIALRDFTIRGSGATAPFAPAYPILLSRIDGLTIEGVRSEHSRIMGMAVQYSTDVRVLGSQVEYARSDGINVSLSADVTVSDNTVRHADDDGIAVQSGLNEPGGVRRNLVIAGNRVFDANGVRVGGARHASITGNILDSVRSFGISIEDFPIENVGAGSRAPPQAVSVVGNTITNVINREAVDGQSSGHAAIIVTGASARAGSAAAIPGEPSTATGAIKDPIFEFRANSPEAAMPTPGSVAVLIANNVVARTLPPTDGTDGRFTKWSDLGQGTMWLRDGAHDPSLTAAAMRPVGVHVFGGVVRDALITGNIVRGTSSPFVVGQGVRAEVSIRGNRATDFTTAGLLMGSTGKTLVEFDANALDADPYLTNPGRGAGGTWTASAAFPTGIYFGQASAVFARGNTVRNLNNVTNAFGNPGLFLAENHVQADIGTFGAFSTANKGIGFVPENSARLRYVRVGSDPTSVDFGAVLTMPSYP